MLSHRAVYSLTAGKLANGSDVAEISGRLVIEAIEECDGFIFNQRIVTRTTGTHGEQSVSDLRMALWESSNGQRMRFNLSSLVDGRMVREDNGSAQLDGAGKGGTATFQGEEPATLTLPAGTLFPTAHNLAILRMARSGGRQLPATVFDGSAEDGVYDTFTAIGRRHLDSAEAGRGQTLLQGLASWQIRIGYFLLEQRDAAPDFEIGYTLFDNGVSGDLELDYGDLVIAGRLSSLEALPTPACTD